MIKIHRRSNSNVVKFQIQEHEKKQGKEKQNRRPNSSNREKSKEQFEQQQQSHPCSVTFDNKTYGTP
jgi:hypothetical protein